MDNWEAFKTVLQGDLEAWDHFVSQLSNALDHEIDLQNRNHLKATLAPMLVYQEVTNHYIEVMEQMEAGTYDIEVSNDGGNSEES